VALAPGTRLGAYEIISLLGAGGMGEVYKARDTRLDRTVAIKVLHEHLADNPDRRARFEHESRAISKLNHPHICTLYDVGRDNGLAYLVVEYLEGETLADRLQKNALPLDQVLAIAIQIAGALDAAHRAGIVHRDLKPANVMLTKAGAKLLDFGIARMTAPATSQTLPTMQGTLTAEGTLLGTVQYMAPEQLEEGETDARTDIFAFGSLLYEMLTGQRAFNAESQSGVIAAILDRHPPPIAARQPHVPRMLEWVVDTCLAKAPDSRWQNAADLTRQLQWIAEHLTNIDGGFERQNRRGFSGRWLMVPLGLLIAAAATVPWIARRRTDLGTAPLRLSIVTPPTTEPYSFALSPDGHQLVFAGTDGGSSKLWLRSLDDVRPRPLTGTEGATYPFWSPDSRAIGFFANRQLMRLDLTGEAIHVIADAPSTLGGSWSVDGVILFALNVPNGLMQVSATGGTPTAVKRRTPGEYLGFPAFLPDGHRFLFYVGTGKAGEQGVYLGSLDAPETRRVIASDTQAIYVSPGYLITVERGVLFAAPFDAARGVVLADPTPIAQGVGAYSPEFLGAFSASSTNLLAYREFSIGSQLAWVGRNGAVQRTLGPLDDKSDSNPELAPDGTRVAVMRRNEGNLDIWLVDTARATAERFTSEPAADGAPIWSPDGKEIVFGSNRGGVFDIYFKSTIDSGDEQLKFSSPYDKAPLDWSPDGRFILYGQREPKTGQNALWALPVDRASAPFLAVPAHFAADQGQFSPDGKWIAFRSSESGGIYISPFRGSGRSWRVSDGNGSQPRWRHNGKELFYITSDGTLMFVPIALTPRGDEVRMGKASALFATHLANVRSPKPQYAVSSDGQRFLIAVAQVPTVTPLTFVINWPGLLTH
jgi:serine/threonine protein kinase/Tol biopolymer transport system component